MRAHCLATYRTILLDQASTEEFWPVLKTIGQDPSLSLGEQRLITKAPEIIRILDQLPPQQQQHIREVVSIITEGQQWDLTRFEGEGIIRLSSEEELDLYTFQVAGCVGQFWTRLAHQADPQFSSAHLDQMESWGVDYGKSLQLINILRDVPEDLEKGRCYLPGHGSDPNELLARRQHHLATARRGFQSAHNYCDALHGRRLGFSSRLPVLIGEKTLDQLENTTWEQWQAGVKIPRSMVYQQVLRAIFLAK